MGCGKLLVINKLQFLPKTVSVMGQELGALLTQRIVFDCVKKGWGSSCLTCSLLQDSGDLVQATKPPSNIFQEKACHSPSPHHPLTSTQKSEGKSYLYKIQGKEQA